MPAQPAIPGDHDGAARRSGRIRRSSPGPRRRRHHRRRHHRHEHGAVSRATRRFGCAVREGAHRRRAVEPQLGLVPQDGARSARDPAGHRKPASVAGDEPHGRGRDRVPHLRDHVSRRERGGPCAARRLARPRPRIPARYQGDRRRRGGPAVAWLGRALGRRALHRERRQGRAANGGAGNRRGGAPPRCRDPHRVRRARHRDRGRACRGGGDRKGPHRLRLGGARRRCLVASLLRQSRHRVCRSSRS